MRKGSNTRKKLPKTIQIANSIVFVYYKASLPHAHYLCIQANI